MPRLGLFGGSFDPVHFGHLLLAETCREQAALDEVWFMPAAAPPHKQQRQLAEPSHRVAMLELAIAGHAAFQVSRWEIERGGVSYTVDTLRQVKRERPQAELFFLMGADSLLDLPTWREPEAILELAVPIVVQRHGAPVPRLDAVRHLVTAERLEEIRRHQVEMPMVELSSSDLRNRCAAGRSIRYQTPRPVEQYIGEHRLYRLAKPPPPDRDP